MSAVSKDIFAAAAAHGLSERVVTTWHPELPRSPRVLVPIQLDALAVRESGRTFADCRMRAPAVADPEDVVPAGSLLPAPFTDESAPRARGIYLHWALPDSLARGLAATDGASVSFPAVPDRWLVLRLSPGTSQARRAVRGWVIEGGSAQPKVTPLDSWTEPGENAPDVQSPLTALGHGDPAWSAYFANVVNRFGFHDDLAGVANGPLSYVVCGWHSNPSHDPLGEGIASLDAFQQRLHQLGWELGAGELEAAQREAQRFTATATIVGLPTREARFAPEELSDDSLRALIRRDVPRVTRGDAVVEPAPVDRLGVPEFGRFVLPPAWWPQHTLYHGAIVGLGWPNAGIPVAPDGLLGGEVGGPPSAGDVRVSVGNTMTEALAALVADNSGTVRDGRMLEAVLLGLADELDQPDGVARLDTRLHADAFGALSSGETTEIIKQRPLSAPPAPHVPDPTKTDPGVFRSLRERRGQIAQPFVNGLVDAQIGVVGGTPPQPRANALHISGTLLEVVAELSDAGSGEPPLEGTATNEEQPPVDTEVTRTLPRRFVPPDPVILVEGAKRSFKHGHDGIHLQSGRLLCRITGHTVRQIAPRRVVEALGDAVISGEDLLERGAENGSIPPECESLLRELALLDPGSAETAVFAALRGRPGDRPPAATVAEHARTFAVEQMAWWVARDPRRDVAPLSALSGIEGVLPSPFAISPPAAPWVPLHLDWEAEYIASPNGVRDWELKEVDFDARADAVPAVDAQLATQIISGRALLSAGAARTAASAVRRTIEEAERSGGAVTLQVGVIARFQSALAQSLVSALSDLRANVADVGSAPDPTSELDHLADELEKLDVLSGALDRFHTALRGGFLGDGVEAPATGQPKPDPFVGVRAGFLRFRRLRLVDCFGQTLYLAGSSVDGGADNATLVRSQPLSVEGRPDLLELAPRFTSPARLWFRFVDANDDAIEATGGAEHTPVSGFVLPNHLDGDLQFYASDGAGIGAVRPQADVGIVWEDAPGTSTTIGKSPLKAIDNRHLARIAQGLLDWGVADTTPDAEGEETALSALLRIIDSTLWTVDPFGHVGDEHLSLLVAHPVAVMRAKLRIEVQEPIDDATVKGVLLPLRIGALAHWEDGLLAYFVNDDYLTLHVPDPACARLARPIGPFEGFLQQASATSEYYQQFAADIGVVAQDGATPVSHAYVDESGVLWAQPNQDVWLTLLMEPHSVVHATSGLLPRKEIGMRREWVARGLSRLAPVFRFGPVLVDPKRIRMPVATDIRGTWSWSHRVDPTTWADEPVIQANADASLPQDASVGQEGWLKLNPPEDQNGG